MGEWFYAECKGCHGDLFYLILNDDAKTIKLKCADCGREVILRVEAVVNGGEEAAASRTAG